VREENVCYTPIPLISQHHVRSRPILWTEIRFRCNRPPQSAFGVAWWLGDCLSLNGSRRILCCLLMAPEEEEEREEKAELPQWRFSTRHENVCFILRDIGSPVDGPRRGRGRGGGGSIGAPHQPEPVPTSCGCTSNSSMAPGSGGNDSNSFFPEIFHLKNPLGQRDLVTGAFLNDPLGGGGGPASAS